MLYSTTGFFYIPNIICDKFSTSGKLTTHKSEEAPTISDENPESMSYISQSIVIFEAAGNAAAAVRNIAYISGSLMSFATIHIKSGKMTSFNAQNKYTLGFKNICFGFCFAISAPKIRTDRGVHKFFKYKRQSVINVGSSKPIWGIFKI